MDVSKIKGEEGDINTCKRCVGKVKTVIFERHFLKKKTYPLYRSCSKKVVKLTFLVCALENQFADTLL